MIFSSVVRRFGIFSIAAAPVKMGGIKDIFLVINLFEHYNEPAETSLHCSNFVVFTNYEREWDGGDGERDSKSRWRWQRKNKSFKTVKFMLLWFEPNVVIIRLFFLYWPNGAIQLHVQHFASARVYLLIRMSRSWKFQANSHPPLKRMDWKMKIKLISRTVSEVKMTVDRKWVAFRLEWNQQAWGREGENEMRAQNGISQIRYREHAALSTSNDSAQKYISTFMTAFFLSFCSIFPTFSFIINFFVLEFSSLFIEWWWNVAHWHSISLSHFQIHKTWNIRRLHWQRAANGLGGIVRSADWLLLH